MKHFIIYFSKKCSPWNIFINLSLLSSLQSYKEQLPPHLRGGWHFAKQNDWGSNKINKEGAIDLLRKFAKSKTSPNYDLSKQTAKRRHRLRCRRSAVDVGCEREGYGYIKRRCDRGIITPARFNIFRLPRPCPQALAV